MFGRWFGRFVRRNSVLLAVLAILVALYFTWFVPTFGYGGAMVGGILSTLFEVMLLIFMAVIQFVAIFWFLSRPRVYWLSPEECGVTFADYRGNRSVLDFAERTVTLLRGVRRFKDMGGEVPRGLLLVGPPGTGKSYLAQAIAGEAGVPFCYSSAPSFQSMFFGIGTLTIMSLYRKARKMAREYGAVIIFIDEIDAIGASRMSGGGMGGFGGMFGGNTGMLNQLLMEMDPPNIETGWAPRLLRQMGLRRGRVERANVFTMGATNLADVLDPALLRPGRFDHKITVDAPDADGRRDLLEFYMDKVRHEPDFPFVRAAAETIGFTPVMIKHIINQAVVVAHFEGREEVAYRDFTEAREMWEWGLRQPIRAMSQEDRRRLAYHEAGHAVARYLLSRKKDRLVKVTIVRHGDALGFAAWKPLEERHTASEQELRAELRTMLASRAAEELFLGTRLSGVLDDFRRATQLAGAMVGALGMEGSLYSPLYIQGLGQQISPDGQMKKMIERLLNQSMESVRRLLEENAPFVHAIAEALMARDELSGDEVEEIAERLGVREPEEAFEQLPDDAAAPRRGLPGSPDAAAWRALPAAGRDEPPVARRDDGGQDPA